MAYKSNEPTITKKYQIEIPTNEYWSTPCLFKVHFGKKFYIGKCKALVPFIQGMADAIERSLRTGHNDDCGWFYHIICYVKKNRVMRGKVEIIYADYGDNHFEMLRDEQLLLKRHKNDIDCLNNNFDSHIPSWMNRIEVDKFKKWKDETTKSNRNKNTASNSRKKH